MKNNLLIHILYLVLKHKRFTIINVSSVTIAALIISLLLPKWYFSYATLKLSSQSDFNIGSIIGDLADISFLSGVGLGAAQANINRYIAILESRSLLDSMLTKFELQSRYKKKYRFLARKEFLNNSLREGDPQTEILTVGVYDTDPRVAEEMAKYYVTLLDQAVQKLFNEDARNNRIFIERRVARNRIELREVEDNLAKFQDEYGIYQPEEQLLLSLRAVSELEAQLLAEEIKLGVARRLYAVGSSEVSYLQYQIDEIRSKINIMKTGAGNGSVGESFLIDFKEAPELALKYVRLFREVEIQSKLMEFLLPIYEKAKLDEIRDVPSILVIDEPQLAEYKAKPKRAYIVIGAFLFSLFFSIAVIVLRSYFRNLFATADENLSKQLQFIESNLPFSREKKKTDNKLR